MSITVLVLDSSTTKDPDTGVPLSKAASFAIWDTAGATAYTYNAGGIPLDQDVQTWLNANSADLFAQAQSGGQQMPPNVSDRAMLFQSKAPSIFTSGCVAATLKASSLFAGFATAKKNVINAIIDSAATTENAFVTAPGFVLG